jgi:uncharacterized peroxidase-related enzyme
MTSRIATPAADSATGTTAELFAQIRKSAGGVPNAYAAIGALAPAALRSVLQADAVLAGGTLTRQDIETIKLVTSTVGGCDYCVAAHSLLGRLSGLSAETLSRLRAGQPTGEPARDALARLVRVLLQTRGTLPQAEFEAIRAAGYSDAQLAEISLAIALIVFTNVFNRINDTTVDFPAVD